MMNSLEDYIRSDNGKGSKGLREYWWAYAIYQGRVVIDGWYSTEQQANQLAYLKLPCRFEVICLKTYDRAKATQAIKHQVLESTEDIDQALRYARHKIPQKEVM